MTDTHDYSKDIEVPSNDDILAQITQLADEQRQAEEDVVTAEGTLKKAQEALRDISERQLPELMDEVDLTEFKTGSGLVVKVLEKIRAGIPKARNAEGLKWLRDHEHAALIKRVMKIQFAKGEDEVANSLLKDLVLKDYNVDETQGVHPSTLAAFVKEQLEAGRDIPMDLLGVFRQRFSKIS